MLDRLLGICLTFLAGAAAIYLSVRLIRSVATALLLIVAAAGGAVLIAFIVSLIWQRQRMNRW